MKAQASPNIAFIKYWGKQASQSDDDRNLALNPSISLTLSKARSETLVVLEGVRGQNVRLDGRTASSLDMEKISGQLARVARALGRPVPTEFQVSTQNNFPSGTGIASSASGFAALTLAAVGALLNRSEAEAMLREKPAFLSALARRGSGSAARSIEGPFCKWDGDAAFKLPIDWPLRDTLVVFSKEPKKISSSQGHQAALSSPLLRARLDRLPERIAAMELALREKNLSQLGPLIEAEALEMHEVARAGNPPADYLLPQTRDFLESLPAKRDYHFTIDAGPNLHFISERKIRPDLEALLRELDLQGEIIEDQGGSGASFLDS
jgi:diphosphomevalonate decarboxylase